MSRKVIRRKCRCCRKFFTPDYRNVHHQAFCTAPDCRRASKAKSQRRWLAKSANRDYFRGADHVERVQQWRKAHPGYWTNAPNPFLKRFKALIRRLLTRAEVL